MSWESGREGFLQALPTSHRTKVKQACTQSWKIVSSIQCKSIVNTFDFFFKELFYVRVFFCFKWNSLCVQLPLWTYWPHHLNLIMIVMLAAYALSNSLYLIQKAHIFCQLSWNWPLTCWIIKSKVLDPLQFSQLGDAGRMLAEMLLTKKGRAFWPNNRILRKSMGVANKPPGPPRSQSRLYCLLMRNAAVSVVMAHRGS